MDQEADAGNYGEHGQRQAVQHRVEADVEITDRHPVHSGTLTACLPLAKKSTPTYAVTSAASLPSPCQRRRKDFPTSARGEGQQHKANQWQKNG